MDHKIKKVISEAEVEKCIAEIAAQINTDYEGKAIHLIGVLNGASFFLCELAKKITIPVTIDFVAASSYGSGIVSSGNVVFKKDLNESIEGRDVIVVEDILDTGRTLNAIMNIFRDRGPASLRLCVLLEKPERHAIKDIKADYCGFVIPDFLQ